MTLERNWKVRRTMKTKSLVALLALAALAADPALAQDTKVKLAGIDIDGMHTLVRSLFTC